MCQCSMWKERVIEQAPRFITTVYIWHALQIQLTERMGYTDIQVDVGGCCIVDREENIHCFVGDAGIA